MGIRNLFRKSKAEDVRKTYDGKTFILSSYDDINKLMDILCKKFNIDNSKLYIIHLRKYYILR